MTPAQIANKYYPDELFNDCKMGCMRCDNGVCENQESKILSLTKDIFECVRTLNPKQDERNER